MKKLFFILTMLVAGFAAASAQEQTATLQQGENTTAYYGMNAFKEAYAAAKSGAVITLSSGYFNTVDSITKSISIIGCGYNGNFTSFVGQSLQSPIIVKYNYGDKPTIEVKQASLIINTDNVKIDGIKFDYPVVLRKMTGLRLSHCSFTELCSTGANTNAIIDQCYIKSAWGNENAINGTVKNSIVDAMRWLQFNYLNSVIYKALYWGDKEYMTIGGRSRCRNSILGYYYKASNNTGDCTWNGYSLSASVYNKDCNNCIFFLYPYAENSSGFEKVDYLASHMPCNAELLTNGNTASSWESLFDEDVQWSDPSYIKTTVLGDDGTVVGPYGGTGFSLYPSIPRITESKIDTYTDGEGQLNVKVKVEVGQ